MFVFVQVCPRGKHCVDDHYAFLFLSNSELSLRPALPLPVSTIYQPILFHFSLLSVSCAQRPFPHFYLSCLFSVFMFIPVTLRLTYSSSCLVSSPGLYLSNHFLLKFSFSSPLVSCPSSFFSPHFAQPSSLVSTFALYYFQVSFTSHLFSHLLSCPLNSPMYFFSPFLRPFFSLLLVCNIFPLSLSSLRVRTFPKDSALLGRDTVRALMYYALKVWSDIAPLNFHEVAGSDADIQIDFTKADHDDGYPFDGPGGTVAHAFFPGERFTAGDTHFDDDEAWTFRSPGEESALQSAVLNHSFYVFAQMCNLHLVPAAQNESTLYFPSMFMLIN